MKGLRVSIYKSDYIGPQDQPSTNVQKLTLVGVIPNMHKRFPELFEPTEDAPAAKVVHRHIFGEDLYHIEVIDNPMNKPGSVGPMHGGNFAYTSDGRFPWSRPLAIHDRYETQAHYDANFI